MSELEINKTPLKVLIPYRTLSVVFGVIMLWNILIALPSNFLRHLFAPALMYAAYAGLDGVLAYGFWKMKKWIVPILGGMVVIVAILNIINVIRSTQEINRTIIGFVVLGALFLFTYLSRNFLEGEYKNWKALGLFLAFLIISQTAIFFLKFINQAAVFSIPLK